MTIQEAIKHAEDVVIEKSSEMAERIIGILDTTDCKECMEQHKQLAEWLEELQQYRAIGTVEDIKEILRIVSEGQDDVDESGISTGLLHILLEYAKYTKIGTAEKCREAREKQITKIPNIWGNGCDNEGNIIYDMYDCPGCGESYEIGYDDYKYCPECGQAIDRSVLKVE